MNLEFLQRRDIYHKLTTEDVPSAFLNSEHRPPQDASLSQLIQSGHFRRAADLSLRTLVQTSPEDAEQILALLYTRLACLLLVSRPDLAAEEALPLTDLLARHTPSAVSLLPLIPWDFRLLLVRLQAIAAPDGGRRGIMALYALAAEVRANVRRAHDARDERAAELWSGRLRDLGLRVCDALVEMGELETAQRHLDSLVDVDGDECAGRKVLLRVRVGDVRAARAAAEDVRDEVTRASLHALLRLADGEDVEALEEWRALSERFPEERELFVQNAAVAMLYTGGITAARRALEEVVDRSTLNPTLLFNLSTVYELCSERAVEAKTAFAARAAAKQPGPESGGWERAAFEFKL